MSNIKHKRRKNDDDKLSKYSQDTEIVIYQKSNIIFKKVIRFKTRNNNKKTFNYKFNENNVVDYTTLVKKSEHEIKI